MKLVGTLPERSGFLHAVPVFDLFVVLLFFFLLGPSFVNQAGIEVELPVSGFHVDRQADATVITITPGDPPVLWLERQRMSEEELMTALDERREKSVSIPSVYLRADGAIPAAFERQVAEAVLRRGFRVNLLGRPETRGEELR